MKEHKRKGTNVLVAAFVVVGLMVPVQAMGQLAPLPAPTLPDLTGIVVDQEAAIRLGKALFWDMQAGSDGRTACATCHFQAGADVRTRNTVNPGPNAAFDTVSGPGVPLPATLPIAVASDDILGSQGILRRNFVRPGRTGRDVCSAPVLDTLFGRSRQVTGRNSPSVINSIYHFRTFWDGRANNIFNGVNPSGPGGVPPASLPVRLVDGVPTQTEVAIPNASLASQATGPPMDTVEMSCVGRTFPHLGRKMLRLRPLGLQRVARTDSVFSTPRQLSLAPRPGLSTNYRAMIRQAFHPDWWRAPADFRINGFTQMEHNFSLYWGLSIMLYQATLVSDQTPLDNFLRNGTPLPATLGNGNPTNGMGLFTGRGRCDQCHDGFLMSGAVGSAGNGFENIGVRPLADDSGDVDNPGRGEFKTPGLRNIELTGPYFHNGGKATLRDVMEFYNLGGDFGDNNGNDRNQLQQLDLTTVELDDLVAFMLACTDPRVKNESAPFDHPTLVLPNGRNLPATGRGGRSARGLPPLAPFRP
ncbi:MAG: cytochrome c peroxidase [Syntrophobacteraceae bacterium]